MKFRPATYTLVFTSLLLLTLFSTFLLGGESGAVTFKKTGGRIVAYVGGKLFASYAYSDPKVPRPSFVDLYALSGSKVTRNYPPQEGDQQDHLNHTGLFFTFGDLNGLKFWNLRGQEVHERFLQEPQSSAGVGAFAVQNNYVGTDGQVDCVTTCRYTIRQVQQGVLLELDFTLLPGSRTFRVGSVEEGGLGLRVATPIAISSNQGGRMLDSEGRSGGDSVWGKQSDWVDYSGMIDGHFVGVTVMTHPRNFSRCWWHARDYGLIGANPFGPLNSDTAVKFVRPGESIRLRYAVLVHSHGEAGQFDPGEAYRAYLAIEKGMR